MGSPDMLTHWPYVVAMVGRWWGLFRVPPSLASAADLSAPCIVSWHATETEAERAQHALATGGAKLRRHDVSMIVEERIVTKPLRQGGPRDVG
jgi:hypothetical protein